MYKRKWTDTELKNAVENNRSIRQVILTLGLVPAGGNYQHVQRVIAENNLSTSHFSGKGWAAGMKFVERNQLDLKIIMVENSYYQSYKLKKRLFDKSIKKPVCELCGWAQQSEDGRIPVELDHINGNHLDNRLENLRILCPNCHSLQTTHRGINKVKYKKKLPRWRNGIRSSLKNL